MRDFLAVVYEHRYDWCMNTDKRRNLVIPWPEIRRVFRRDHPSLAASEMTKRLEAAEAARDAARRLVDEWTDDLKTFPVGSASARSARAAVELCIKELTAVLIERDAKGADDA